MILVGDIGGTKTKLAMAARVDGAWRIERMRSYESQRFAGLEAVIEQYLREVPAQVDRACFGVAGPVLGGEARITNLPWHLSAQCLGQLLGVAGVSLINDLTALAYAVPELRTDDLVPLQEGRRVPGGAIGIIAPGTGLGEGYLTWDGARYRPGASEGGHADFAPADATQVRLLEYLWAEVGGHVSWERVLSGPGLVAIHRFLRTTNGTQDSGDEWLAHGDAGEAISARALASADPLCVQALHLFVSILGAQAGNVALTLMATGGVYLGGGIPPKILPLLQDGAFLNAFRNKGRLSRVLEGMPVHVICNPDAQLLGAAACAAAP